MKRSLAFGLLVLAIAQPALALAAPTRGLTLPRPVGPASRPVVGGGIVNQGEPNVPIHINIQPGMEPRHFSPRSPSFTPIVLPYRRNAWQSISGYFWYPTLNQPACSMSNNLWNASSAQLPADLSIGSLVDGKANILSAQSYDGYVGGSSTNALASPFAFQIGFSPPGCGTPGFTNL